ncbi:hypothetical protein [Herbaspirillum huttiense]|uniref:hypothetical protein n=1 Tax=Herbaspirillum huttiense TaxID=863372 RepID=UPI0039B0B034
MKIKICLAAKVCLVVTMISPAISHAEVYAQAGYRERQDGVILMTQTCTADKTGQLKYAVGRLGGHVREGCYLINHRGNAVVRWQDGAVEEIPAGRFDVKAIPKVPTTKTSKAWLVVGGKEKCIRLENTLEVEFEQLTQRWGNRITLLNKPHDSDGYRSFFVAAKDSDGQDYAFTVTDSQPSCFKMNDIWQKNGGK